ncbi:MAG TPA: hypothetical protein VFU65_02120 [Actinocrinis sp.]|nr:hypothetical protein [Actinocrinis sp.]
MGAEGWWGILLQGSVAAVVGGLVAALTAWAVVSATHRSEQRLALIVEARRAAVQMYLFAGECYRVLRRAARDPEVKPPTADTPEWWISASTVEIAMFSLEGAIGAQISQDLGDLRRSLEMLNAVGLRAPQALADAQRRALKLTGVLAGWLMDGRHRTAPCPDEGPAIDGEPFPQLTIT